VGRSQGFGERGESSAAGQASFEGNENLACF